MRYGSDGQKLSTTPLCRRTGFLSAARLMVDGSGVVYLYDRGDKQLLRLGERGTDVVLERGSRLLEAGVLTVAKGDGFWLFGERGAAHRLDRDGRVVWSNEASRRR